MPSAGRFSRSRPRPPATAGRYLLALLLLAGLNLGAHPPASLSDRIGDIISRADAEAAFWGIYIQDLNTGRVIYRRNADKTMLPASNQKLLTTAVALDALGGDFRYETTLHFDGKVDGSVLRGDLILEGSGDPTFGSDEMPGEDPLRQWAADLAGMGVTRIEGRLIGDDDVFDDNPYAKGWDIDYVLTQSSRKLGISTCGLAYRDNVVSVKVRAGRVGAAPTLTTYPEGYLDVRNDAMTHARRRGDAIRVRRTLGTEYVQLYGSVARTYRGTVEVPVANPTAFTLYAFKHHLEAAGIEVDAEMTDIDALDKKPDYARAEPLFVHLSPTLSEIVREVNKKSNNFYAEQLLRTYGWGGSVRGAEQRIKEFLDHAGASTGGLSIRDGSGLSRKNMVTPEAMGHLLAYMYRHPERDAFANSLAAGGEPKTTLRSRLDDVPVRAKTGSLEFVRALSGYTVTPDGRPVAFTLFANNYATPSYRITRAFDEIVRTLATETAG